MKKRILLLCILTMLFSTGMEGCPDLDPIEYVDFTLTTTVKVQFIESFTDAKPLPLNPNGTGIKIEIAKAGGERCVENLTVGIDGTATLICTHVVWKEQPVIARTDYVFLPDQIIDLNYQYGSYSPDAQEYSWETIFSLCGNKFGSSCASTTELQLLIWLIPPSVE